MNKRELINEHEKAQRDNLIGYYDGMDKDLDSAVIQSANITIRAIIAQLEGLANDLRETFKHSEACLIYGVDFERTFQYANILSHINKLREQL